MKFEDLGLSPELLRAVTDAGYIEPTPIQEKAIPVALQGRDLLGCAQTGTGKTAAFTLPMIDILAGGQAKARMPRSLILTPTRELATQISENFEIYGKQHRLTMALLIGGVSIADQENALGRGVDVLIATPGRLLDLFGRGKILLAGVKILVIDEADRMLDMGFIPDVERIVGLLPPLRQTLFFSATMPREIRRLAEKFLHNPKEVHVDPPASPAETVSQGLVMVSPRNKNKVLRQFLDGDSVGNALIFCNRKRDVDTLNRSLRKYGYHSAALHGDMTQPARTETLETFKKGEVRFLVATDVAGRGLDIYGLSHVFNFDVPTHAEDYVHRIGRTGRAGHRGRSITLGVPDDRKFIAAIERLIGRQIPRVTVDGMTVAEAADTVENDETAKAEAPPAKRHRRRADTATAKPKAPVSKAAAEADAAEARSPGKDKDTPPAPAEKHDTRKSAAPAADKTRGGRKRKAKEKPRGDAGKTAGKPVLGLGDHVPAFLQRSPGSGRKK